MENAEREFEGKESDVLTFEFVEFQCLEYPTASTPISDLLPLSTKTIGDFEKVTTTKFHLESMINRREAERRILT